MRLGNFSKVIAVATTVVWAAGCSTTNTTSDSSDSSAAAQSTDQAATSSASTTGAGSSGSISSGSMSAGSGAEQQGMSKADVMRLSSVFYFDFDQAVIQSRDLADLNAHAEYLAQNGSVQIVLEGHADERGTREYNMALGERRAKAVARYLTVQGVSPSQIETVSYGEERPSAIGHDESSWSQNRRVELKYDR